MSDTIDSTRRHPECRPLDEEARASGWIDVGFSRSFAMKRLLLLVVTLAAMGACVAVGQGVLAFVVLAIGLWPLPFRFALDERGLRVSWFVLREWIPWSQMVRAELEHDSRRWVLGRRARVLRLHRRGGKPVTLRGDSAALEKLCAAIAVVVSAR